MFFLVLRRFSPIRIMIETLPDRPALSCGYHCYLADSASLPEEFGALPDFGRNGSLWTTISLRQHCSLSRLLPLGMRSRAFDFPIVRSSKAARLVGVWPRPGVKDIIPPVLALHRIPLINSGQ